MDPRAVADALARYGLKLAAGAPPPPAAERRPRAYERRAARSGVEAHFDAHARFDATSPMATPGTLHRLEG